MVVQGRICEGQAREGDDPGIFRNALIIIHLGRKRPVGFEISRPASLGRARLGGRRFPKAAGGGGLIFISHVEFCQRIFRFNPHGNQFHRGTVFALITI